MLGLIGMEEHNLDMSCQSEVARLVPRKDDEDEEENGDSEDQDEDEFGPSIS